MQLDWIPKTESFVLKIPRSEAALVQTVIAEHGFDFSQPASSPETAVLFTKQPYAAAAFSQHANANAQLQLCALVGEIDASWAKHPRSGSKVGLTVARNGDQLWPFQRAAVDYCLRRQHSLVGDQPGLGKTPTAISIANEINAKRVLVLCPANIRLQWARQIRNWSNMNGRYIVYPILQSGDGVHPQAAWTIVSYDLARTPAIHTALLQGRYDLLILDEGHYLKSPEARRTRAVFDGPGVTGLYEVCERIVALTGTPLPNRPRECYTLARGLDWSSIDFMSEEKFTDRFNPSSLGISLSGKRYSKERTGRLPELQNRLRANFMVRRLKRDVLDQLPEVRYQITHVDKTGEVKKALEAESMLAIDPEQMMGIDAAVFGQISVVRKMMGVAMAPQVADYVEMLLDGGEEKLFLVGWHIEVLNILEKRLGKFGMVRVDGSTSGLRRQRAVDDFRADSAIRIFLGNIQAIGIGVDGLQSVCSHMVGAEASWTPGENAQVADRLHRMGQEAGVLIEWMVAPGSFSEKILGTAIRKLGDIHSALDKQHN